jgi:hypothetical protein
MLFGRSTSGLIALRAGTLKFEIAVEIQTQTSAVSRAGALSSCVPLSVRFLTSQPSGGRQQFQNMDIQLIRDDRHFSGGERPSFDCGVVELPN